MGQTANEQRGSVLTNYPNTGKSYGFTKAAAGRDEAATILQPNRDLRASTAATAEENFGVEAEDLPSFPEESPLMDEDSPWYSANAVEWYGRGMPPRLIMQALPEDETPPPEDDPYQRKMQSDIDENDLLVGDPVHAFLKRAVRGRHVAMDDIDPYSSFVTEYDLTDDRVRAQVMEYVEHHRADLLRRGVDIDTYDQVTRPTQSDARGLLDLAVEEPSAEVVPETDHVTAATSRIVRVLASVDEGQRDEWVEPAVETGGRGTKHTAARIGDHVIVAGMPLDLKDARSLLMLTATPVLPVFEQVFEDLDLRASVNNTMTVEQRKRYFDEMIDADVVQTTKSSRFVSGGSNTRPKKFSMTVEEIEKLHGEKPLVISSKKALTGALKPVIEAYNLDTVNFARAVGTNEFGDRELALVWGAPHYGDDYVERVAAFCGDFDAEAIREDPETGERVETHWSTETSQEIYENMCEGTVFQAMLRVGRSAEGRSTIYVETDKIPNDVPRLEPRGEDMFRTLSEGEREVVKAADNLGAFTVRELNELTTTSRQQIYNVLNRLVEEGAADILSGRTGDYNAKMYRVHLRAAAEGLVSESVRKELNDIIMQKPSNFRWREPDIATRDRVLRCSEGAEPLKIVPDGPDTEQLDVGIWQTG